MLHHERAHPLVQPSVNSIHPHRHLFIRSAANSIAASSFLHSAGSKSNHPAAISSFVRRRIPLPRRHFFIRPAVNPITPPSSLHSFGDEFHCRDAISSFGWQRHRAAISSFHRPAHRSPRRNHFSRPANPIAALQSFHRAGESNRALQSFQWAGKSHRRAAIFSVGR